MDSIQAAPVRAIRTGQRFGGYLLERPLGRGAFATVFLGRHLYLDTKAAIKILHRQFTDPERQLFNREAYMTAHLAHPSIVRVFDYGVQSGRPYMVMNYAPGGTLGQFKGMELPLPLVVDYARQIASGLDYLHARRIVHCDIKPENLLIGRDERILIGDFGIAFLVGDPAAVREEIIRGTPTYMAPEQLLGNPSFASDQYALAIVLYELLSGHPPFGDTGMDAVQQHLEADPPLLRERGLVISLAVEEVIAQALAKDPERRYRSAGQFAQALERAASASANVVRVSSREQNLRPSATAEPVVTQQYASRIEHKAVRRPSPLVAMCLGALGATAMIWLLGALHYSGTEIAVALLSVWLISGLFVATFMRRWKTLQLVAGISILALLSGLVFHNVLAFVATSVILLVLGMAVALSLLLREA